MTRVSRRGRIRVGVWVFACASCVWGGGGCAVNGYGLLGERPTFRANDRQTGRSVMIDSWGINLSTVPGDAGVTLGRVRRTYFFAGPASAGAGGATARPAGAAGEAGAAGGARGVVAELGGDEEALRLKPGDAFAWPAGRPIVVRGRSEGVSVEAGAGGTGVRVGVRSFEALRLPAESNVLILIKSRSSRPADDVFHVKEFER